MTPLGSSVRHLSTVRRAKMEEGERRHTLGVPENVRIVTLGCAKNEVDSEEIAGVTLYLGNEAPAAMTGAHVDVFG